MIFRPCIANAARHSLSARSQGRDRARPDVRLSWPLCIIRTQIHGRRATVRGERSVGRAVRNFLSRIMRSERSNPSPSHPERIVAAAVSCKGLVISLPSPARHIDLKNAVLSTLGELTLDGSNGFLTSHPRAHRQWLAKQRYRRPHALELPELNGLSCPLTDAPWAGA
jgi:hypothetical protein